MLNAVVCSGGRELEEALSAATIALEISSRNSRVAALQKRWDWLRACLDLILNQRGADMTDLPSGASGRLCLDCKGKNADRLVTRIDPGVVLLVAELRAAMTAGRRKTGAVEDTRRGAQGGRCLAGGDHAGPAADRRGVGLPGEEGWRWRNRGARTTRWSRCRSPSTGCTPW
jgi:hypothetical protein